MPLAGGTFRIFVSSTFSDLKAERNALQEKVFPRLRDLCLAHGCRFQAIDLRWGVSGEAALDQQTMNICFAELKRCQRITPRPNFIVLLGDRYGWRPLPPQIDAREFEEILTQVSDEDRSLLAWDESKPDGGGGWYRRDDNAVPAEYCLQARKLDLPDDASEGQRAAAQEREALEWAQVERRLRDILLNAIAALGWRADDPRRVKFECSATHQEIRRGALALPDEREHVFAFLRDISNLDELAADLPRSETAREFLDTDEKGHFDEPAHSRIAALKEQLSHLPGVTAFPYPARWTGDGLDAGYLDAVCEDAYQSLSRVILEQVGQIEEIDPASQEIAAHRDFAQERARHFIGREDILETIDGYISGRTSPGGPDQASPLVIHGPSGSGKSALMARAMQMVKDRYPEAYTIARFIGASPASTDLRSLLDGLCREIYDEFAFEERRRAALAESARGEEGPGARRGPIEDPYGIPTDAPKLSETFRRFVSRIPAERQVVLMLDALDQLSPTDNAHSLNWLPQDFPANVRIVVSVLDREDEAGACLRAARAKVPEENLLPITTMTSSEGAALLETWLKEARRTLQPGQRKDVLDKFALCPMPLYLKVAFEEARRWRSYDGLPCGADEEPGLPASIEGVIGDLLWRLERPADHGRTLVAKALGYLCAARNGLSEDEILDMLSLDQEVIADFRRRSPRSPDVGRLPVIIWSRLHADLEPYLTERNADNTALLGFYHRQLGEVAAGRYLAGESRAQAHSALASYFGGLSLWVGAAEAHVPNQRKCSELPYQQAQSGLMWGELEATLTDLDFVDAKSRAGMVYDLISDYNRAIWAWPGQEEKRREEEEHQARIARYVGELVAYSGDPDNLTLPPPPRTVDLLPQKPAEERRGDWTQLERVQGWSHFVANHVQWLGKDIPPAYQPAWNSADGGPVAEAMELHAPPAAPGSG